MVVGEIAQDEIAVLLKELVLPPIASVRDRVRKVLRSVNLNDDAMP
jgi:energy-coupling factor transporter ATP-binding protein EcfA2